MCYRIIASGRMSRIKTKSTGSSSFFLLQALLSLLSSTIFFLPRSTWEVISRLLPWWWLAVINSAVITGILRTKKLLSICVDNFCVYIVCCLLFTHPLLSTMTKNITRKGKTRGLVMFWLACELDESEGELPCVSVSVSCPELSRSSSRTSETAGDTTGWVC